MAFGTDSVVFDELAADPGSPEEGELWYNTTDDRLKVFRNGTIQVLAHVSELTTHTADTGNPHATTLEQARTAGDTFAGNVNMGSNLITNIGNAVALDDAPSWGQVIDRIQQQVNGLDWQESVLDKDLTAPPGGPALGDRYIVAAGATGAWAGQDNDIAEWDGAAWVFITPDNGTHAPVEDESNLVYVFSGAAWSPTASGATDHGALTGLGDDDHTQYHTDGRALTWLGTRTSDDLPEGATNLYYSDAKVALAPAVVANTAHAAIVTGNPHAVTKGEVGLGNVENILSNFAAGVDPTVTDDNTGGYSIGSMWYNTTSQEVFTAVNVATGAAVWVRVDNENIVSSLIHKAGTVPNATFASVGGRQKATVAFSSAFADALYAVEVTAVTTNNKRVAAVVESKTSSGFTINLGTNNKNNVTEVDWTAIKHGESA